MKEQAVNNYRVTPGTVQSLAVVIHHIKRRQLPLPLLIHDGGKHTSYTGDQDVSGACTVNQLYRARSATTVSAIRLHVFLTEHQSAGDRPPTRKYLLTVTQSSPLASSQLHVIRDTRKPPDEATLIPVTTPSQPTRAPCTAQRLLLAG